MWSGRQDLNLRPPAPKAGALTRLRYAPILQDAKDPIPYHLQQFTVKEKG